MRTSARTLALRALVALERGRSERLRSELEGKGVEGRDLAFAFELSHGVLRRERLLDHVLLGFATRGLPKDPQQLVALRLGAYQLLFLPGMKSHAAVNETVGLIRNNRGFVNAILRKVAGAVEQRTAEVDADKPLEEQSRTELPLPGERTFVLPNPLPEDAVERLAIEHALPEWLAQRFFEQHGLDGLRTIALAASTNPGIYLRASRGVERDALRDELLAAEVEVTDGEHDRLLQWLGGSSPFASAPFRAGRFVVQDPTALEAVQAVPCRPGDTVVDLCAAPGTKTTWLGEQVQPGGQVFAYDPIPSRRSRIVDNVRRLGLGEAVTVVKDVEELPMADCVMADVPCSNTGVLGRRVEARWRLWDRTFVELPELQREILDQAVRLTRPGGHTVYSTCSIDREENEAVIEALQAKFGGLELIDSRLTLPVAGRHDGGFFAVLRRGEDVGDCATNPVGDVPDSPPGG